MRISDWSSDVCSSDLADVRFLRQIDRQFFDDLAQQAAQQSWLEAAAECGQGDAFAVRRIDLAAGKRVVTGERAEERLALHHQQIGRASCRDRVCPYV